MSVVKLPPAEQHIVLTNVDWDTYITFSNKIGDRNIRCNYNGVDLELMTISPEHERVRYLFALLLSALAEEMNVEIAGFGSMTCRRKKRKRGFEPDQCYWIAHEPQVHGRDHIDLKRDPPPDLVIEVEISRSFVDRLAIAARLGVPEIWRWDGQTLRIMVLGTDGEYTESPRSTAFPFLPVGEVARFLQEGIKQGEMKLLRSFRAWVREQIARGWGDATA